VLPDIGGLTRYLSGHGIAKRALVGLSASALTVCFIASSAAAQTPTSTPSQSQDSPKVSGWVVAMAFIAFLIFIAAWFWPIREQNRRTQNMQERMFRVLEQRFSSDESEEGGRQRLTAEEFRDLMVAVGQIPSSQGNLDRSLMAFAVLTLFAVAFSALLVSDVADAPDLRKTAMTGLINVIATIIGFFFGARTAESRGEDRSRAREAGPGSTPQGTTASPPTPGRTSEGREDQAT
jgi:hypothetical protein